MSQDGYAALDDFLVQRDEDGEILPIDKSIPGFGLVQIRPMVYGESLRFRHSADQARARGEIDVPAAEILRVFQRHILQPDFGGLKAADIHKKFRPTAVLPLLQAILDSGDLGAKVTATDTGVAVEFDEGND